MPYRQDTDKQDQGWGFFAGDSASLAPNEDDPAIMAPAASEHCRTCKTSSKQDIPITTGTTLTPCRSGDTSAWQGSGGGPVDDSGLRPGPFQLARVDGDLCLSAKDVTK
jgi:hypothetical protein